MESDKQRKHTGTRGLPMHQRAITHYCRTYPCVLTERVQRQAYRSARYKRGRVSGEAMVDQRQFGEVL